MHRPQALGRHHHYRRRHGVLCTPFAACHPDGAVLRITRVSTRTLFLFWLHLFMDETGVADASQPQDWQDLDRRPLGRLCRVFRSTRHQSSHSIPFPQTPAATYRSVLHQASRAAAADAVERYGVSGELGMGRSAIDGRAAGCYWWVFPYTLSDTRPAYMLQSQPEQPVCTEKMRGESSAKNSS